MSENLAVADRPPLFGVEEVDRAAAGYLRADLVGPFPCEAQLLPLAGLDGPGPPNAALVQRQANFPRRR